MQLTLGALLALAAGFGAAKVSHLRRAAQSRFTLNAKLYIYEADVAEDLATFIPNFRRLFLGWTKAGFSN